MRQNEGKQDAWRNEQAAARNLHFMCEQRFKFFWDWEMCVLRLKPMIMVSVDAASTNHQFSTVVTAWRSAFQLSWAYCKHLGVRMHVQRCFPALLNTGADSLAVYTPHTCPKQLPSGFEGSGSGDFVPVADRDPISVPPPFTTTHAAATESGKICLLGKNTVSIIGETVR